MSQKAEAHARRVGEIVDRFEQQAANRRNIPDPHDSFAVMAHKWAVKSEALSSLAAEHANALERIEELEKDLARAKVVMEKLS